MGSFAGSLFDVRVFSRALSASEVLALSQPPLVYPNTLAPAPVAGATSYSFPCAAGFYGPTATLARSAADNSWSWSSAISCTPCPANTFSLAGSTSSAQCRASPFAGPTDTVFSFYGTAAEIAADYSVTGTASSLTAATNAFGNANSALAMTGAAYVASAATLPVLPSGNSARTSSVWIKASACSQVPYAQYIYAWGQASPGNVWSQLVDASEYSYLWGWSNDWRASINICDGKWHNLVFTLNGMGGEPLFYVDGLLASNIQHYGNNGVENLLTTANTRFFIGSFSSTIYSLFSGSLFDIRVYKRALSASEVLALSQPPLAFANYSATSGPVAGATSYTFSCNPGFASSNTAALVRSSADNSWSWAAGSPPSCALCPANTFSSGGSACTACAAGTTSAPGSTSCTACPFGTLLNSTSSTCVACGAGSYNFGGAACASCPVYASLAAPARGCSPSANLTAGPPDTAFYLSGSQAEGVSAFANISAPSGVSFGPSVLGAAGGALSLSPGSYITLSPAPGSALLSALPTGGAAFSTSAWVKCAPVSGGYSAAFEWGSPGDSGAVASTQTAALVVGSAALPLNSGVVTTLASNFNFGYGGGLAVNPSTGNLFVADTNNNIIRIVTPTGSTTTFAGSGGAGSADGTGASASFNNPYSLAYDPASATVAVADTLSHRIRLVSFPGAVVTTLAGSSQGYADGTGSSAQFAHPRGVAFQASTGNIYVADAMNYRIRVITPAGVVATVAGSGTSAYADGTGTAASFSEVFGIAFTSTGALIVADQNFNRRVRVVSPTGIVTTLAGGAGGAPYQDGVGTSAVFHSPGGNMAVLTSNTIVMNDGNRVRSITFPEGVVTTIAGVTGAGYADGTGTSASFNYLQGGVAILPSGAVAIGDSNNNRIRLVTLPPVFRTCDLTWHHLALTYSPTKSPYSASAFVDGALAFQLATSILISQVTSSGAMSATGGTVTFANGNKIHTFATSDTLVVTSSGVVNYLVVAGGGSGGIGRGGGGGAGGVLIGTLTLPVGSYTVTVGAGGARVNNDNTGANGGISSLGTLVSALGGGGGAGWI